MDNPYYETDREDLARFRAGLPPLVRKEIVLGPEAMLSAKDAVAHFTELFSSNLKKGTSK